MWNQLAKSSSKQPTFPLHMSQNISKPHPAQCTAQPRGLFAVMFYAYGVYLHSGATRDGGAARPNHRRGAAWTSTALGLGLRPPTRTVETGRDGVSAVELVGERWVKVVGQSHAEGIRLISYHSYNLCTAFCGEQRFRLRCNKSDLTTREPLKFACHQQRAAGKKNLPKWTLRSYSIVRPFLFLSAANTAFRGAFKCIGSLTAQRARSSFDAPKRNRNATQWVSQSVWVPTQWIICCNSPLFFGNCRHLPLKPSWIRVDASNVPVSWDTRPHPCPLSPGPRQAMSWPGQTHTTRRSAQQTATRTGTAWSVQFAGCEVC